MPPALSEPSDLRAIADFLPPASLQVCVDVVLQGEGVELIEVLAGVAGHLKLPVHVEIERLLLVVAIETPVVSLHDLRGRGQDQEEEAERDQNSNAPTSQGQSHHAAPFLASSSSFQVVRL